MSERDPRVAPKPGDVFAKGISSVSILIASGERFTCNFSGKAADMPPLPRWNEEWLPGFRRWAATAEVIHRAEDAATGRKGVTG